VGAVGCNHGESYRRSERAKRTTAETITVRYVFQS
jgi:hypothetical protein